MRSLLRAPLALAALGALGCATVIEPPRNNDVAREAWVGPWDEVVRRHDDRRPQSYNDLRAAQNLTLSSLWVGPEEPARLRAGACVLIVVEGRGEVRGPDQTEALEPGRILLVPDGLGVVLESKESLRAVLFSGPRAAPAGSWRSYSLGDLSISESPPGGINEVARLGEVLSLRTLTVFPLGGLQPHVHLAHDTGFLFLSGEGALGIGSEDQGKTSGPSAGDQKLKRSFRASPVSEQALVFLPAGSMHTFSAEGRRRVLALQVFGPAFDGRDGFTIPERREPSDPK